jgi:hypothetical protein
LIRVKALLSNIDIEDVEDRDLAQREDIMSRYVVRFVKDVPGENGREAEICQRSMEIDAKNKIDAAELAKWNFCKTEELSDWSLHADRIQILDADFPS